MIAYGAELAEIYEAIYRGRGKNYEVESDEITKIVRSRNADAMSLLDMACGTGGHLGRFAELFEHVEGMEISPPMRAFSTGRVPGVEVHEGDMRSFSLKHTFDAITCLFSSVGYLGSVQELDDTLRTFRSHVAPGGVVVIEPWWSPDTFIDRYVGSAVVTVNSRTIARVSHTVREGAFSRMEVQYVVATPTDGIHQFTDTHVMALFTQSEYESAFVKSGFAVEHLTDGPAGRGLFIGVAE